MGQGVIGKEPRRQYRTRSRGGGTPPVSTPVSPSSVSACSTAKSNTIQRVPGTGCTAPGLICI
eukprot:1763964-Rhodomonas_salina.3